MDILQVGQMLSDVMSPRRVSCEVGSPDAQAPAVAVGPARPEAPTEKPAEWALPPAHRPGRGVRG